jgi:hydroxymethylpyrimidine kinase/phosphomethylpyrimidine kinase/thiamine-phosphate diphosphorylase
MNPPAIVWTVAGSDSGGGAGLQADLRAFDAFGAHGCSAVAAITAQNSVSVQCIDAVSPALLDAQLAALAEDMPPAAIKTGLLGSAANLRVLVAWVDRLRRKNPALALVVDPVLRASTGAPFADPELLLAYRTELLPRATLATPNRTEAAALLGIATPLERAGIEQAANALRETGCQAVAITGGDSDENQSEDYASTPHASGWLSLPRVATPHGHGTGCVFASTAAAALASGFVAIEAVVLAKMATTHALRHGYAAGAGAGPVRPRSGFALQSQNLPAFSIPRRTAALSFPPLADPALGLYAVVDSAAWVRRVLDAGVRTVQLRIKDPHLLALRSEIRESVMAARAVNAQFFVNDHWQAAIEEGAYGVHLGQEDLATADLAAIAGAGLRLGVSTHAYWEVCRAWTLKPSYIACGPIHPTGAKAMPWIPQGNDNLAYWCALLPLPVVAIGGMDVARATQAARCGASGVAVISAIMAAFSPENAIAELMQAIDRPVGKQPSYQPLALPQSTLR